MCIVIYDMMQDVATVFDLCEHLMGVVIYDMVQDVRLYLAFVNI